MHRWFGCIKIDGGKKTRQDKIYPVAEQQFASAFLQVWGEMVRGKKPPEDRPELLLSMNYLPQAERLTVVIMKAKSLGTAHDVYVKVRLQMACNQQSITTLRFSVFLHFQMHLIVNGKRVKKKKTSVRKINDTVEPTWNEAFTFNLSQSNMPNAAIEVGSARPKIFLQINWRISRDYFTIHAQIYMVSTGGESKDIGSCGIGPREHGRGRQHWQDMTHAARKPTSMWHYLR